MLSCVVQLDGAARSERYTTMTSKIFLILGASLLAFGMFTFQACYESHPHYGPNYGRGYASEYALPPAYGDYDEHREWHDSNWWVSNRRDWVQQHHPDWVKSERHEGEESRDKDKRHENSGDDNRRGHDDYGHEQGNAVYDHH
jgi:hypothetical protein